MIRNSVFLSKVLRISPKLVIHVGADKGQDRAGYISLGAKKIIWCEADPQNVAYLHNQYPADTVWSGIIWSKDNEEIQFHVMSSRAQSSAIRPIENNTFTPSEVIILKTLTLDRAMLNESIPKNSFLTIDVQGAELHVLQGAKSTLSKVRYVVIEIAITSQGYEITPSYEDIFSFLREFGFRPSISRYSHDDTYKDQLFVKTNLKTIILIKTIDSIFDTLMKLRHLVFYRHFPAYHYFCRICTDSPH